MDIRDLEEMWGVENRKNKLRSLTSIIKKGVIQKNSQTMRGLH